MKVPVAAFARLHGVTPCSVYLWGRAGVIEIVDGGVDVQASNRRLAAAGRSRIDPRAPLPAWLSEAPAPARRGRPRLSTYLPADFAADRSLAS